MKAKCLFLAVMSAMISTTELMAQNFEKTPVNVIENSNKGDLYKGMSKSIPAGRVIIPYGISVTFDKTVHLIFPSAIKYVDLGSDNIIAGEAEDADNVLRVKAAVKDFEPETNLSVICDDGSYYTFNVKYAKEPPMLSIEMKDFLSPNGNNLPSNRADIYFKELGKESPVLVRLVMKTIYKKNKNIFKHLGVKNFGLVMSVRSIYTHNGLYYFNVEVQNKTNVNYRIDNVTFKVQDGKQAKRTAIQEHNLDVLRAYNLTQVVPAKSSVNMVFALEQFTMPENKELNIILYEAGGARNLVLPVQNDDLLNARAINNLKLSL